MQTVVIMLQDWEHQCCGDRRTVGDEVTISVYRGGDGGLHEIRHDYTGGREHIPTSTLRGRLRVIAIRPAIIEQEGIIRHIVGFRDPVPCESTDAAQDQSSYDLVFTLETDDALPTETWVPSSTMT